MSCKDENGILSGPHALGVGDVDDWSLKGAEA
jgi:hypothetical protein